MQKKDITTTERERENRPCPAGRTSKATSNVTHRHLIQVELFFGNFFYNKWYNKVFFTSNFVLSHTVCPRSLDPIYIVSNYIKWFKTSWTYSTLILKEPLWTVGTYIQDADMTLRGKQNLLQTISKKKMLHYKCLVHISLPWSTHGTYIRW